MQYWGMTLINIPSNLFPRTFTLAWQRSWEQGCIPRLSFLKELLDNNCSVNNWWVSERSEIVRHWKAWHRGNQALDYTKMHWVRVYGIKFLKYSHFYQLCTFYSELPEKSVYTSHSFQKQRHYAPKILVLCQHYAWCSRYSIMLKSMPA